MTRITIIGRATADPELRFTPAGAAVATFNIADNHRKKVGDKWEDDGATFYRCQAWNHLAEQCAETITKGKSVIVTGEVRNRTYENRDGSKGQSLEIRVDDVGLALPKYAREQSSPQFTPASGDDPWATAPALSEPPF